MSLHSTQSSFKTRSTGNEFAQIFISATIGAAGKQHSFK